MALARRQQIAQNLTWVQGKLTVIDYQCLPRAWIRKCLPTCQIFLTCNISPRLVCFVFRFWGAICYMWTTKMLVYSPNPLEIFLGNILPVLLLPLVAGSMPWSCLVRSLAITLELTLHSDLLGLDFVFDCE